MKHLLAGEGSARPEFPALVVNWHVTQACNYRCGYCYAQWEAPDRKEVIRDRRDTKALVRAFHADFGGSPASDALLAPQPAPRVRLNFAGGEPLLFASRVLEAMQFARALGLDVSLITNGSRLTPALMEKLAPLLTILGVSIDALDRESNLAIGRRDSSGRVSDVNTLADLLRLGGRATRPAPNAPGRGAQSLGHIRPLLGRLKFVEQFARPKHRAGTFIRRCHALSFRPNRMTTRTCRDRRALLNALEQSAISKLCASRSSGPHYRRRRLRQP
jgi:hypothetical protein